MDESTGKIKEYRLELFVNGKLMNPPRIDTGKQEYYQSDFQTLREIYEYTTKFANHDGLLNAFREKYRLPIIYGNFTFRITYYPSKKLKNINKEKAPRSASVKLAFKDNIDVFDTKATYNDFGKLCSNTDFVTYISKIYKNFYGLDRVIEDLGRDVLAADVKFHMDILYRNLTDKSFKDYVDIYWVVKKFLNKGPQEDDLGMSWEELQELQRESGVKSLVADYIINGEYERVEKVNNPYLRFIPTGNDDIDEAIKRGDFDQIPDESRDYYDNVINGVISRKHK